MSNHNISYGQSKLRDLLREIYPTYILEEEFHLGNNLRLDLFIRDLGLAFEFHGRQHYEFVEFFHGTYENYLRSLQRDTDKQDKCLQLGICLIIFSFESSLEIDIVKEKIQQAVANHSFINYDPSFKVNSLKERKRIQKKENKKPYKKREKTEEQKLKEKKLRQVRYLRLKQQKEKLKNAQKNSK